MNADIVRGIGIGAGISLPTLWIIIVNFDKILLVLGTLLKPLSFIPVIFKVGYRFSIQGKINDICKGVDIDLFGKRLKIRWIKRRDADKPFALSTDEEIIVHVVDRKNTNQNILDVVNEYVASSFVPNLKYVLDEDFVKANQDYIISKILKRINNASLSVLYTSNIKAVLDEERYSRLKNQMYVLDRSEFYFPCFINTIVFTDKESDSSLFDDKTSKEVENFCYFLLDIAEKSPEEEPELTFSGHLFKVSIILVAKRETLSLIGLKAHIDRIKRLSNLGVERIYVRGIGRANIINTKKLAGRLQALTNLNKIYERTVLLPSETGREQRLHMILYENYSQTHYKVDIYDKEGVEEIKELLNTHIPEIENGSIQILGIARERGILTKILVKASREGISAIGCCLGENAERKHKIESKLQNETLYFIEHSNDPNILVKRVLYPFDTNHIKSVELDKENMKATISVEDDKVGLAIGKLGCNVKTAYKVSGWQLKILKESEK